MNEDNFSYYLLRNIVLPNILEEDTSEILYWSGKKLFTDFKDQITSEEDLIHFFEKAQFGNLNIKKSSKTKYEFVLSGDWIIQRIKTKNNEFSLETGFLCEYVQSLTNSYCLSNETIKSKEVIITINIDYKSEVN
ncbi:hypothetical protein RD055328_00170 [Companilactobacillus sp. RD055328]|uniref:DUF2507 domain-containing protein n=1 Tax=Companilactobacillus sp. RD055328 TaxID=2916634 RepID=UPI001FC8E79B|nr:DUF2507 domain-containing protein [Companilactobacillus sp. RD055328]GKQ42094.1 hypothetical protein RD055328_00170 [Companilactobacillus sp. RD055328]